MKKYKINTYENVRDNIGKKEPLSRVLSEIKTGRYKKLVSDCRQLLVNEDASNFKKLKSTLPCFSICATFAERKTDRMEDYNHLIILDFDSIPEEMFDDIRKKFTIPYTYALFTSVSGAGLKVIVEVNTEVKSHLNAFTQVSTYYEKLGNIKVDQSGKDVTRLCYYSYDSELYLNEKNEVFIVDPIIVSEMEYPREEVVEAKNGSFASTEIHIAFAVLDFCIENSVSITNTHEKWYKTAFALSSLGLDEEEGKLIFLSFCRLDGVNHDEAKSVKQFEYAVRKNDGRIGVGTLVRFAKEVGFDVNSEELTSSSFQNQFWYETLEFKIPRLKINAKLFIDFLDANGFRVDINGSRNNIYRIHSGILHEVSIKGLKSFLKDYINELTEKVTETFDKEDLMKTLLDNSGRLLSNGALDYLDECSTLLQKDSKDSVYFYFRNCVIKVTAEEIISMSYKEINGAIFKSQIIDFEISIAEPNDSSGFRRFVGNASPKGGLNLAIGYLLSRYKNPSNAKAVIFVDAETDGDESNGGRGKSLVYQAIGHMRKIESPEGKNFEFNRFIFQNVTMETNLFVFDDVPLSFDFEKLYPAITGSIVVEKKGKTPITITFPNAPKILITTNFVVQGKGGYSEERRKYIVEFSSHYGEHLKPNDELGFNLFDDYTEEQWNDFYNTMFGFVQHFLRDGLINSDIEVEKQKRLLLKTNRTFLNHIESEKFELGEEYDMDEVFKRFLDLFPRMQLTSARTFYKWLRIYAKHKGWVTAEQVRTEAEEAFFTKRSGDSFFTIVEIREKK